ncbi:hypothetical protein NE237_033169 [Protea cynaroides]|uniref:F-box domain-containing protein n=1 Tax=Protea cynaroides TaxID=273540 RepID=A0A9Q0R4B4_9MAGN|nr:hypothetical protein NE237_033169 [Protea cynaroides]
MAKEDEEKKKIRVEESVPTEYLPEDLIVDILSRLPVKFLLIFRCVCKLWYVLINDPVFIKMHISRSLVSNSNLGIIFRNLVRNNFIFGEVRVSELHNYSSDELEQQTVIELNHPFKLPHYLGFLGLVLGSCNGLPCLCSFFYNAKKEILLWNPSTRRNQKVPSIPEEYPKFDYNVYGFGHEPTTDYYTIVRIVKLSGALDSVVAVYSLSTNSWKRIENMPFYLTSPHLPHFPPVLANSALHWFADREPRPNSASSEFIASFDLQDEEYRELPLPDSDFVKNNVDMNLGVLGGQLCVLCSFLRIRVEVWLMKEYGVRDSWEKQFSIEQLWLMRTLCHLRPICYS